MKKKTYRLCLLSLVVIALIGGFFYYRSSTAKDTKEVDGTFVKHSMEQMIAEDGALYPESEGGNVYGSQPGYPVS